MKKKIYGTLAMILACIIAIPSYGRLTTYAEESSQSDTTGSIVPYTILTSEELTEEMGAGWNLGNTMDGHTGLTPNETLWQNVTTTKALIKAIHDQGFNTVRIPVTWGNMIHDDYSIDEKWISRVQDIVDYCISLDMYTIINMHHDGSESSGWIQINADDLTATKDKYTGAWKTIAERFQNYDEHLIFESLNEVKGSGMTVLEENEVIMQFNQLFVDTIRSTGGNNGERWLMVPGKYNYIDSIVNPDNAFELPVDTVDNRIILSVHCYTPWTFCGAESEDNGDYDLDKLQSNINELKPLYDTYTSKGIPVVVGEYGCINKNNSSDRAYYLEAMNRLFQQYGLVGVYWDQGWYDDTIDADYSFSLFDRETGESLDTLVTDSLIRGFAVSGADDLSDITKNTVVTEITDIELSESEVSLEVGEDAKITTEISPSDSNDVVLWKSEDESVATTYNGLITAKGEGTTTVTAYTQSGSVTEQITVNVTDINVDTPCDSITVAADTYDFTVSEYAYLGAQMSTADTDEYLYYRSSDESVVTVSSIGKILAVGAGTATVDIYSSGGVKTQVVVNVSEAETVHEIELSLNVYYNSDSKSYYSNEVSSQTVSVTENGQYSLTFDCGTDLSDAAIDAGVTTLDGAGAIYIKDHSVTSGVTSTSPLQSCDIKYDSITVNGKEMTITNSDYNSALKDSGIFDTNNPINVWDGSVISEVSGSTCVKFDVDSDPLTITVTFTLDNIVFDDGYDPDNVEVETTVAETTEQQNIEDETDSEESSDSKTVIIIVVVVVAVVILGAGSIIILKTKKTK